MKNHNEIIHTTVSDFMKKPRIVRLSQNLYAAVFELIKIVPAKYVLEKAIRQGKVKQTTHIVETSSGTYGLGLAIVCAENNLKFTIFSDPIMDINLKQRLESLGGTVKIIKANNSDNPQVMRLNALRKFLSKNNAFWPEQYNNIENRNAYHEIAFDISNSIRGDFNLIGPVGSGGATCGLIEGIRRKHSNAKLIGVDTFGSILFGLKDGKRILRGLGNSLLPKNLAQEYFDEIHWLDHITAYAYTRYLHSQHAIFSGPTSGATYAVARKIADLNPDKKYVFIAPDSGHRYSESVYSENLSSQDFDLIKGVGPIEVEHPLDATPPWSFMHWNRQPISYFDQEVAI